MQELVLSREQIHEICVRIGGELTKELANEEKLPLFVCTMKGALYFMGDLLREVKVPCIEDYVQISSYEGTQSTGKIIMKRAIGTEYDGRTVVIVEDIVDTGLSMDFLIKAIKQGGNPKRILVAALFDKAPARKIEVPIDFVGVKMDKAKFLIGYGLDYDGLGRNTPYVYVPTPEEIESLDRLLGKQK